MSSRILIFFVLFLLPALPARAQDVWEWLSPANWGSGLNAVVFLDPGNVIAVGDHGLVLQSSDTARTWVTRRSDLLRRYIDVDFDGTTLLVLEENGGLLRSTDRGSSWSDFGYISTARIRRLISGGSDRWFALSFDGTVLRSDDGGFAWNDSTAGGQIRINDVSFLDSEYGICVGDHGQGLRTTDGGQTWNSLTISPYADYHCVQWLEENKLIVGGRSGLLLWSSDVGSSWQALPQENSSTYRSIAFDTSGYGMMLTDDALYGGYIDDQPVLSRRHLFPQEVIEDLACSDGAWVVVGKPGYCYTHRYVPPYPGALHYRMVRGYPPVITTNIESGVLAENGDCYLFTDGWYSFRSSDRGNSWQEFITYSSKRSATVSSDTTIDFTIGRVIFRSNVDGTRPRWLMGFGFDGPSGLCVVGDSVLLALNTARYLRSGDGGGTWDLLKTDSSWSTGLASVVNDSVLFTTSASKYTPVMMSTDAGRHWSHRGSMTMKGTLTGLDFVDENEGWLCSTEKLVHTTDGGASWNEVDPGIRRRQTGVLALNRDTIYVAPGIRSLDGGATWSDCYHNSAQQVVQLNNGTLLAFHSAGQSLLVSHDIGRSWDTLRSEGINGNRIARLAGAPSGFVCVLDWDAQDLLVSEDNGLSWDVRLHDSQLSSGNIACGGDSTIYIQTQDLHFISFDRGHTWNTDSVIHVDTLTGIAYRNFDEAVVTIDDVYVLCTEDGWTNVQLLPFPVSPALRAISVSDDGRFLVPGAEGRVLSISAAGDTVVMNTGARMDLTVVRELPSGILIAAGELGTMLRSRTPAGSEWNAVFTGSVQTVHDMNFATDFRGMFVTETGSVFHTFDGGKSWQEGVRPVTTPLNASILFSENDVLVAGDNGVVLRSAEGGVVSVHESPDQHVRPVATLAAHATPNPARSQTTLHYRLPGVGEISIAVYDILGRRRNILLDTTQQPGLHSLTWNTSALANGMYFIVLTTSQARSVCRIAVLH